VKRNVIAEEESMSSKKLEEALKKVQAVDEETQAAVVGGARPAVGPSIKPVGLPTTGKTMKGPACVPTVGGVIGRVP
jgi:hypothetical protein